MSSPMDILFEQVFGHRPKKSGTAYEIFSTLAMKLIEENSEVHHDKSLRGEFSETLYQIDVLVEQQAKKEMGEAKDYTIKGAKVGRADLQKLGGALADLSDIDGGIFFSATDYTGPAKKYAEASQDMFGKEITLYHLRPSTVIDEEGRMKTLIFTLNITLPDYKNATFIPIISDTGQKEITSLKESGKLKKGDYGIHVKDFYDKDGRVISSVHKLTSQSYGGGFGQNAIGTFYLTGHYFYLTDYLIELNGLTYDIPFSNSVHTMEIHAQGEAKLLIKDEAGRIDTLITDEELKKIAKELNF